MKVLASRIQEKHSVGVLFRKGTVPLRATDKIKRGPEVYMPHFIDLLSEVFSKLLEAGKVKSVGGKMHNSLFQREFEKTSSC